MDLIREKHKAVEFHRECWNWIAKMYENTKEERSIDTLLRIFCEKNNVTGADPCCSYDTHIKHKYNCCDCENCPIDWGTFDKTDRIYCDHGLKHPETGEDTGWDRLALKASRSRNHEKVREYALIIANLPERLMYYDRNENI